jgi:hypothetical protein
VTWVVVVEDVAAQEMGDLLDEALGEEAEFCVGVSNSHKGNGVLDGGELCVKIVLRKGSGANGRPKETEARGELDGESGAEDVSWVGFGGVLCCGLVKLRVGIGKCPDVEVRMRVFIGLTKHPRGAPIVAKLSHKNWRSSRGTQAETSST